MSENNENSKPVTAGSECSAGLGGASVFNYKLIFHNEDGIVGEFNFDNTPATFVGNVDESARIFVDAVIRMWGSRA